MVRTHANPEFHLTTPAVYIVVDLEDIQAVMEDDADTNNSPRIHLERWARLKRQAMSALRYRVQFTEDSEDACPMAREYLAADLQRVSGENFDQKKRSLILKAEEDKIVFKEAGF